MALKHTLAILSLVVTLLACDHLQGQVDLPSPRFRPRDVESPDNTRPFADPGVFNYDAQVFAPVDFTTNEELDGHCGFFFTYDRLYTSFSRSSGDNIPSNPNRQGGTNDLWGNRYQFGWYSEDDAGWLFGYQQSEGLDFVNGGSQIPNPTAVTTIFSSVELNRIFRQQTERGGFFEPYMGVRYLYVSDNAIEDTPRPELAPNVFNSFTQEVNNNIFGLHAGGRYSQRRGRFRFSGDAAIATTYNEQRFRSADTLIAPGSVTLAESNENEQSFVPVFDAQVDMAYNISRDIAIRGGVQFIYLWDGIARANTLTTNFNPNSAFGTTLDDPGFLEDGVVAAGFTFGFEWRR